MSPLKSKATDSWAKLVSEGIAQRARLPVGEGWKTRIELSKEYKLGRDRALAMINRMLEKGQLETFYGYDFVNGHCAQRIWYRPKTRYAQ